MSNTNKQKTVIAAIIVIGMLAIGGVLLGGRNSEERAGEPGHERASEGHANEHANDAKRGGKPHVGATAGKDDHADEAMVRLTAAQIEMANLTVQAAGPARIATTLEFPGEIRFDEDRTAHVVPRVGGVAQAVPASLGQAVKKGDVLAVIASTQLSELRSELMGAQQRSALALATHDREKSLWEQRISAEQDYLQAKAGLQEARIAVRNASQKLSALGASEVSGSALNQFTLRAPFDGIVVEKHLALGEAVKDDASIFTVSDLSTVWAEFVIAPKDLGSVRVGAPVAITSTAFDEQARGKVSFVGALIGEQTRTARARVTLANPGMGWRPGLFVTVALTAGEADVAVTVPADALQALRDQTVVFEAVDGGFRARPVKTGRTDGKRVEIVRGLAAGTPVAGTNTFLLKAELGKAGAEHQH
jgi:cobalt-zinc-cadmium efflux system membrane fusion protein